MIYPFASDAAVWAYFIIIVFDYGFLAVVLTDSYCSIHMYVIQQAEQLYRQGKVVSIDNDWGVPLLL